MVKIRSRTDTGVLIPGYLECILRKVGVDVLNITGSHRDGVLKIQYFQYSIFDEKATKKITKPI